MAIFYKNISKYTIKVTRTLSIHSLVQKTQQKNVQTGLKQFSKITRRFKLELCEAQTRAAFLGFSLVALRKRSERQCVCIIERSNQQVTSNLARLWRRANTDRDKAKCVCSIEVDSEPVTNRGIKTYSIEWCVYTLRCKCTVYVVHSLICTHKRNVRIMF